MGADVDEESGIKVSGVPIISRYVSPLRPELDGDMLWTGCAGALVIGDIGLASLTPVNWERSPVYTCCGNVLKSFGQYCENGGYDGMNEEHWSGGKGDTSREVNPSSFSDDE